MPTGSVHPPANLDRSQLFTPAFLSLLAVQFACGVSLSVFFLLPKILVSRLGAGPFEVGLVSGSFGIAAVAVIPIIAWRIDHVRRMPLLIAAAAILVATSLAFLLVRRAGLAAVGLRGLQGVAWALVYCAGSALVSEMAPRERLAQTIGVWGSANLITSAIAPALAEPLIDNLGPPAAYLLAAASAAVALLFSRRIQETRPQGSGLHQLGGVGAVLRRPSTLRMMAVLVIAGIAYGAMFTFHQPMALQLGIKSVRGFFIWYTVGALAVRLGMGGAIDRIGPLRMSIAALIGYTIVVVGMRNLDEGTLSLYGGLFGVAHGVFFPAHMALIVSTANPGERGRILTFANGGFIAGTSAVLPLGAVASWLGYPGVFTAAGLATLIAVGILIRWPPGRTSASSSS